MSALTREKLMQASALVKASGLDAWLTFDRETVDGGDPVLALILEGGLTWESALIVFGDGRRTAIVGNYDADPLTASGDWDEVVPYVQGIGHALIETLERSIEPAKPEEKVDAAQLVTALAAPTVGAGVASAVPPTPKPRIGVNFSLDDSKADGITHGMFLKLQALLKNTRFEGCLESAECIVTALRAQKTSTEVAAMRAAIAETDILFDLVNQRVRLGMSEREVFDLIHQEIDSKGLGYAWDKNQDPIVNSGPDSMIGHGIPSAEIKIAPGHIFHIDLGVIKDHYSSDIQSCWYVPHERETAPPADVLMATEAVVGAITAGSEALRPGVEGWQVDDAARSYLVGKGYPEYLHAFGHQVGRLAHDGGAILGPKWERYGRTSIMKIAENEVYTLELGVIVEGRGYLGIEEMVLVTKNGIEWLTKRQTEMPLLGKA